MTAPAAEAIDHAPREEKRPLIQNFGEQILGGVRGSRPRDLQEVWISATRPNRLDDVDFSWIWK